MSSPPYVVFTESPCFGGKLEFSLLLLVVQEQFDLSVISVDGRVFCYHCKYLSFPYHFLQDKAPRSDRQTIGFCYGISASFDALC